MKFLKPITPGEILLEEFLIPMGISQNAIARAINVPAGRINQIIKGTREISADTALRLGKFFGIEARFWLNLQMNFNLKSEMQNGWKEKEKKIKLSSSIVAQN
jgi:addiction module HigA family antidote